MADSTMTPKTKIMQNMVHTSAACEIQGLIVQTCLPDVFPEPINRGSQCMIYTFARDDRAQCLDDLIYIKGTPNRKTNDDFYLAHCFFMLQY